MRPDGSRSSPLAGVPPLLIGAALLALMTEASADLFDLEALRALSLAAQIALLCLGAALVAWGLGGGRRRRALNPAQQQPIGWREMALLLLILLAALAVRVWQAESALPLLIDELNFLSAASRAVNDSTLRLLFPISDYAPYTWLYSAIQAVGVTLFGPDLTTMRFASILLGTAQVAAIYFLARELFDRRVALLAALALAFFAPHLHYSRTAYSPHPGDTLFGMLMILFLTRALRTARPLDWALAGVCLGMTQYWYEAGRLFFPALALIGLIWRALLPPEGVTQRQIARGAARLIVGALLVGLPVYVALLAHGRTLAYRFNSENSGVAFWSIRLQDGLDVEDAALLADRLAQPFLFYVAIPESVGLPYYRGDQGMILRPFVPFFLVGAAALLIRPRAPSFILALWIVGVALGNALLIRDVILSPRYGVVAPALALTVALGIERVCAAVAALAWRRNPTRREAAAWTLGGALTAVFALVNVDYYFNTQLPDLRAEFRANVGFRDLYDVGLRGARLPLGTQVIVVEDRPSSVPDVADMLAFLQSSQHRHPLMTSLIDLRQLDLPQDRDLAFFVPPSQANILTYLFRRFPQANPPAYTISDLTPSEEYVLIIVPQQPNPAS
ncbi:MAG: glycosyltransferase family 39 protein [Anaerolineae bacterium]|nr:glycosyltransferase family 39 protein [Anaerolineae bacterium]